MELSCCCCNPCAPCVQVIECVVTVFVTLYEKVRAFVLSFFYAPITIENYESYYAHRHEFKDFKTHLEIGAANYSPTSSLHKKDHKPQYAPTSDRRWDVLFRTSTYVLSQFKTKSVIFLTDLDQKGLDLAAEKLAFHLKEKISLGKLSNTEIKIVKIARNLFACQEWPQVDSAYFMNPFGTFTYHLLYQPKDEDTERMEKCLKALAKTSKTGVYISDVCWPKGLEKDRVQSLPQFTPGSPPIVRGSLTLTPTVIKDVQGPYLYPNGQELKAPAFSYLLTSSSG